MCAVFRIISEFAQKNESNGISESSLESITERLGIGIGIGLGMG
jgi:hypothetical protein